jgi:hypothetical protein
MYLNILLAIIFIVGLCFYLKCSDANYVEGLKNNIENRCPNILIQHDKQFFLYNSKLAKIPGVNPIEFDNLEDYVEFLDWQRSQGIRCPVLYLQKSYDAQGTAVYKTRPGVTDLQGGLPPSISSIPSNPNPTLLVDATQNDAPYNKNSYPSFDQSSYYVGTTTPLDNINQQQENMLYSPDPMDDNWGGIEYTQSLVDKGVYAGNEVALRV